jgi:hypothetical protein
VGKKNRTQKTGLPKRFLDRVKAVTAKRAKTVIQHILKHGYITTEELSEEYGYHHPPRAARDVREEGIPLETFRVTGSHGRKIGAYRFGDPAKIKGGKLGGRKAWPKDFKNTLVALYGSRCGVCFTEYEPRYFQIDHRLPYEVGGDPAGELAPTEFMLLCGSCNRAKSWSCEHCKNWTTDHLAEVCQTCYWAKPENYAHVALRLIRRLDLTWSGDEVPQYDQLVKLSKHAKKRLPEFVKDILRDVLDAESG